MGESIAGTDPRSPTSVFDATVTKVAGGFQIHFTAQANKSYSVMFRNSLTTGAWAKLTDIAAQGTAHPVDLTDTTAVPQRFYQVVTPSAP